jgi:23S rRNA pseudouridine2605 synthase
MRIQRAVARAGLASRRTADALVAAGRVRVNGVVATVGQVVDPARDRITVDGAPVAAPPAVATWYLLHKPAGTLTTRRDERGRPTVFDLVPATPGLTYVGRLDYLTEGVLLLTTDGGAAHRLTHPSREVPRTYEVTVRGNARAAVAALRRGVELDDGLAVVDAVAAETLGRGRHVLTLTLTEGRNREVRRLCEAVGLAVERLVRTRFGAVTLGDLPAGRWRKLDRREVAALAAPRQRPPRAAG